MNSFAGNPALGLTKICPVFQGFSGAAFTAVTQETLARQTATPVFKTCFERFRLLRIFFDFMTLTPKLSNLSPKEIPEVAIINQAMHFASFDLAIPLS
nr:hypothetical protein [Methylomarinum vadi]